MKRLSFSLAFLFSILSLNAQSMQHRLAITAGFGLQHYCGDLGNGFYRFKEKVEYGVGTIGLDYYLSPSIDIRLHGMLGDFGYCSDKEEGEDGVVEAHLNSRMTMGVLAIKYKLANGKILSEHSRLMPFVYAGVGVNKIVDIMKMGCIVPSTSTSINFGAGLNYCLTPRFTIGYNLNFGQLSTDKTDFISRGRKDLYMQNSLMLGFNIF